jgi:hypothetical protein
MILRCIQDSSEAAFLTVEGDRTPQLSVRASSLYKPLALFGKDMHSLCRYEMFALVRADFGGHIPELVLIELKKFEVLDGTIDGGWLMLKYDATYFHLGDPITSDMERLVNLLASRDRSIMDEIRKRTKV